MCGGGASEWKWEMGCLVKEGANYSPVGYAQWSGKERVRWKSVCVCGGSVCVEGVEREGSD